MTFDNMPIQRKLMTVMMLTSGAVLLFTCAGFITYEVIALRKSMVEEYATNAEIIAANLTASLAFKNETDATEELSAFKTDPQVVAACLYDDKGKIFAKYPSGAPMGAFPARPGESGYRPGYLEIFRPVVQRGRILGTVYLKSDLSDLTGRYSAYALLAASIIAGSFLVAYLLARMLQKQISDPILALAETSRIISNHRDFSVRAQKFGQDELGSLTDAFNQMLAEILAQEQALKASEANYREIFEKANEGIFIHEIETGRVLDVNQAVVKMTGYTKEELMAAHPADISSGNPGYTKEDSAAWIRRAVEEGPQLFEWQGRHKNGSVRWIEVSLSRATIGGKERLLAFFREIGDRKKIEEITRLGQDEAIQSIKDYAIVMLDANGNVITWNEGAERLKGYKSSEIIGKNFSIFYPPGDSPKEKARNLLLTAAREGRTEEEGDLVRKDGSRFLADVVITALKNEKGELRGFIKVTRDVTEIIKAQRDLEEQTLLNRMILQNIGDGVVAADEKGKFLIFNPEAERIIGRGAVDAPGHWAEEYGVFKTDGVTLFPENDIPLVKAMRGEETNGVEQFLRNPENPKGVLISVTGRPLRDEEGKIRGGVVIVRDLTEQKRQEALRIYTKSLETSNKELQDFVFVVSHDLQEPLRKIQSFGNFLKEEAGAALNETASDYLTRVQDAAQRMSVLIENLLLLTRVTTRAKPFEPVQLSEVIAEVKEDLGDRIQEAGGRVEADGLPTLEADPAQMRQLFQNLIGNALKFRKPGETPVIKISADPNEKDGRCLIRVADNGIGFDQKYADKIFNIFQRLNGTEYEGTGIGLSICKKVVERHNGFIRAVSKLGQGATFEIFMPLQQNRKGA